MRQTSLLNCFVGGLCLAAGIVFLSANSLILSRGAIKFAHDVSDAIAYGAAAGVVPWLIAIFPMIIGVTWRPTIFGLTRPSTSTLAIVGCWVLFICYNLTGGAGVMASARQDLVAEKTHDADTTRAAQNRRDVLRKQIDGIPQHRPAAAVKAEVDKLKFNRAYTNSEGCKDANSRDQRATCQQIATLESEMASAAREDQLTEQIRELDAVIAASRPIAAYVDPQTELIFQATGAAREKIGLWLPASTPIVLEAGGALSLHFAALAFGVNLRVKRSHYDDDPPTSPTARKKRPEPPFNNAPLISPENAQRPPVDTLQQLTDQRHYVQMFLSQWTRPCAGGVLPEDDWYDTYLSVCRRNNWPSVPIESFRRLAHYAFPKGNIREIDGRWQYFGMLPLVPDEATQ